jgi:hypothetical protein
VSLSFSCRFTSTFDEIFLLCEAGAAVPVVEETLMQQQVA